MKNKGFLFLTTFLCGASIMGVEIASSRFLAPFFGSSMITWTVIIGVILVAMSLGNFLGGFLADRNDPQRRLYQLILAAGVWIALIPIVGKHIIAFLAAAAVAFFPDNLVLAGSVASCVFLFALPCLVLGATSPCMIKAATSDLDNNGRVAGAIYGLSTLGSIFGTFLPTFVTIPSIGTDRTFFLFAAVLCSLAVIYGLKQRKKAPVAALFLVILLSIMPWSPNFAFWETPVEETESVYNYLRVSEKDGTTTLSTHTILGVQSMYSATPGLTGLYYDLALLSPYFFQSSADPEPVPVLILGFATGTFAKLLPQFFDNVEIDGVEIDPAIIELGKRHFNLQKKDARIFVEDGRVFANRSDKKYRIIFVDAFQDVTCPFHMATREFFEQLKRNLEPDGVVAINLNLRSNLKPDLFTWLSGTVSSVFPQVTLYEHPDYYNRIIFAGKNPAMLENFRKNTAELPEEHPLKSLADTALTGMKAVAKSGFILTDDLAPVEMIGFKMLNQQVKDAFREILIRVVLKVSL